MLAAARHSAIIAEVQRERIVRVADLAQLLGVSLMTVRRDIEALDAEGLKGLLSQFLEENAALRAEVAALREENRRLIPASL